MQKYIRNPGNAHIWQVRHGNRLCGLLVIAVLVAVTNYGLKAHASARQTVSRNSQIDIAQHVLRSAQDNDIRFERLSIEHGLSHSSVLCMLQDSQGFMWFGTGDGLNKYDGYRFAVYDHDPENPYSLSNNTIRTIYQDRQDVLWVGTEGGGLNRLDRETGQFTRYQADPAEPQSLSNDTVNIILQDRSGKLWVGTDAGLDTFDREKGTFAHYHPESLQNSKVQSIYQDLAGLLWIGTDDGLWVFNQNDEHVAHYRHNPLELGSLTNDSIRVLYEDQDGTLWVGTDGGLDRFNREYETFTPYRNDPRNPHSLGNNQIRAIHQDRSGVLWIGTNGGGLDRFDQGKGTFVHYRHAPSDPNSLSSNSVFSVYTDREGVLWIGTITGGLNRSFAGMRNFVHYKSNPEARNSLSSNIVRALYETTSGDLWIGTTAGLDRLDRNAGEFTHYQHNPYDLNSLSDNFVLSVYQDREGILWLGTLQGGLNRLDLATGDFAHYTFNPRDPLSLSNNTVRAIYEDRAGNLWVGTSEGLNRFDRETELFYHYLCKYKAGFLSTSSCNDIRAIYQDRTGSLWVGTAAGLNEFTQDGQQVAHYYKIPGEPNSPSSDLILSIYQDRTGILWLGTFQGGLNRFDPQTKRFTHYRKKDGLPNDVVYGILEDGEGNLWLSTNQGLSRFDPQTETFKNYDVKDGLQSNEFTGGAYHQSGSGEMFFGGINGFNAFYPELVTENSYIPPVVLTSLTQNGEDVRPEATVESIKEVIFKWPNNFFEFEFAALSYAQPEKNQYAYMLEGFDQEWNNAGTRRFGKYTNLPGKTYTLHVKGTNNDGLWNKEGTALKITIVPPFWATWWFRGGIALVLLAGAIGGYRLRVRNIEARSRELEAQVEQRTAELRREINQRMQAEEALRQSEAEKAVAAERSRLARELHDAVTQTLFSASLIAEALPASWERDPEEGQQLLQELRQSTRSVLAEMRTLLLELRPAALVETSLGDLLHQLAEAVAGRENMPITVTVEGQCALPPDVHISLYRIAQEALNNIAKHAHASQATVSLRCFPFPSSDTAPSDERDNLKETVELHICDDGRGFDPDAVPPDRLGLGIMRERAQAIEAAFAIESQPGHGTQLTVVWARDGTPADTSFVSGCETRQGEIE